ncbi:unnamed protein product [Urochloa decumbens]|uniref:DUF674 domain-containing protein n=1 Tax=Urochloa decumbens TaxID=240449 RepID=A0ABC8ZQ34_9POAL
MAPTNPDANSTTLSMKLLIDTKSQRVLYAEAGKDVVDFLFSLLTLPVGTVVKILSNDSMVGSISNLYGSVEKLDETYVRSAGTKAALLAPPGAYHEGAKLLQLPEPEHASMELFRCNNYSECVYLSKVRGARCPIQRCGGQMNTRKILDVGSSGGASGGGDIAAATSAVGATGFVKGVVTYTVMDDLKVAPMSTISGITLLNTFGITDIGMLQEKTVQLGYAEGLKILKASLQSKTVLTDVFLVKK